MCRCCCNERGEKLSKQTGAPALDNSRPLEALMQAAGFLGLALPRRETVAEFWEAAVAQWRDRHGALGEN